MASALSLGLACATYESAPDSASSTQRGGGESSGAGPRESGPVVDLIGGGRTGGGAGTGDRLGSAGAAAGAGLGSVGGGAQGAGGAGSAGEGAGGVALALQSWSFDSDAQGWAVREQSPTLAPLVLPELGLIRLSNAVFSAAKQYIDFACTFPAPADLSGSTLRARLRRASGGFVGVQLYAYAGAWASAGFTTLGSSSFSEVTLVMDEVTTNGFSAANVSRIGLKFSTGSNDANVFGPTELEIDEVSLVSSGGVANE